MENEKFFQANFVSASVEYTHQAERWRVEKGTAVGVVHGVEGVLGEVSKRRDAASPHDFQIQCS